MWDRTNQVITGKYHGVDYAGVVRSSRVKLGGVVQHTVDLFEDIEVFGDTRCTILVDETENFDVDIEDVDQYMDSEG